RIAGRGIARSFQDLRLYAKMTVLENCLVAQPRQAGEKLRNVYLRPGWVRRQDVACRQRAIEHLAYVGLQEQADRRAEDLAYGEQKLLAIARLLATEADLLLLDEPTSGLDRGSLRDMIQVIKGLVGQGKTICVIEHNLDVVRAVSDWVVFMDQGKALASGEPEAVLADRSLAEIYFGA
ncbi:MAG: ATP-binding cassette domain-containing protein, partial [Candidatus Rokubacteria bacterium]|nr:ATP-binding cassette domain-containing protein [Candidatus Rokubacteria bacterium]